MYLANIHPHGRAHYVIRETYRAGEHLLCRDLCDLGPHPARFICYPGGNAFYVDEQIEARVCQNGGRPGMHDLEDLLWDFVDPEIRHAVGHFRGRCRRGAIGAESEAPARPAHRFDQRRLYYLRCGRMDQSRIAKVPQRLFRPLIGKSRDEIEQLFIDMEKRLGPSERKAYLFTVLDLQRHFSEHFARSVPQWIDGQRIDECFEREICGLHQDASFWDGMTPGQGLHPYLVRYVIMFFDSAFDQPRRLEEMLNDYINQHRQFHWPKPGPTVSLKEAGEIFEVPAESLQRMSRVELTRQYRRQAQRLHPDKGGCQTRFVRLTEAYRSLMRRR